MNTKVAIGALIVIILAVAGYFLFMQPAEAPIQDAVGGQPVATTSATVQMGTTTSTGQVREFVVEGGMFYFNPKEMIVNEGDTVRIVYKNLEGKHDWVIDEFNVRTQIITGVGQETIEFVANKAGTFEYYCSVGNHRAQGMVGKLVVNGTK